MAMTAPSNRQVRNLANALSRQQSPLDALQCLGVAREGPAPYEVVTQLEEALSKKRRYFNDRAYWLLILAFCLCCMLSVSEIIALTLSLSVVSILCIPCFFWTDGMAKKTSIVLRLLAPIKDAHLLQMAEYLQTSGDAALFTYLKAYRSLPSPRPLLMLDYRLWQDEISSP